MRKYKSTRRVRVGDADSEGRLRVDSIARYLQDIGYDDTEDLGVGDGGSWVARSIEISRPNVTSEIWPQRNDIVNLETYCGGIGKLVAQRNVDILLGEELCFSASTIWVSLDKNLKPTNIPHWIKKAYPEAVEVSSKRMMALEPTDEEMDDIMSFEFNLRQSDMDINQHANNAFAFDVMYEISHLTNLSTFTKCFIEYHNPIDFDEEINVLISKKHDGFHAWISAAGDTACTLVWQI